MQPTAAPDKARSNARLGETVRRERARLLSFIRRRMPDPDAAEDILQDVFVELTEAWDLTTRPIERVASWLFAVARNKISDYYRQPANKVITASLNAPAFANDTDDEAGGLLLSDYLAMASDDTPDSRLFRETLFGAVADALAELPTEQSEVFVRHEFDGQSFRAMSAELGVPVNTLLSRKRYAVLHLREALQDLYDDFLSE
jgi:RNA polymerase sigma factor (sigma-70 family)